MKQKIIISIILSASVLLTIVIYYQNKITTLQSDNFVLHNEKEQVKNKFMQQIDAVEYSLPDSMRVFDMKKNKRFSVSQFNNPQIGLFIDKNQCKSCWENEVSYLIAIHRKKTLTSPPIIIFGSRSNIREAKLMGEHIPFSQYKLDEEWSGLTPLTKFNMPFFFIFDGNKISYVFYPSKNMPLYLRELYFKTAQKKCAVYDSLNVQSNGDALMLLNPIVDLGRLKLRQKKEVTFNVKNNSNQKCAILDVQPSCSCIIPNEIPRLILPNETEIFKFDYMPTSGGDFNKTIRFTTSLTDTPYYLTVRGTVE